MPKCEKCGRYFIFSHGGPCNCEVKLRLAIRDLYRGDGGPLNDYNQGWNDGTDAAAEVFSALSPARRGVEADHELQNAFEDAVTRAERAEAANAKLVGAIDMIRETLNGSNVQDLLLIINNALDEARNV